VSDPVRERQLVSETLRLAAEAAHRYLADIDQDRVRRPGADAAAAGLNARFPEEGDGAIAALDELIRASDGALRSAGPRFFHWVIGGDTPAALAADWLTSAWDQNAFSWDSSPIATACEELSIAWLKELFGLPSAWGGVLTTGATMANFTCLAAGRHATLAKAGWNVEEDGLLGAPALDVVNSTTYRLAAAGTDGAVWTRQLTTAGGGTAWSPLPLPAGFSIIPGSLRAELEARRAEGRTFDIRETIAIGVPLCTRLAELHALGELALLFQAVEVDTAVGRHLKDLSKAQHPPRGRGLSNRHLVGAPV